MLLILMQNNRSIKSLCDLCPRNNVSSESRSTFSHCANETFFKDFFYLGKKQFIVEAKPASNDANRKAKLSPSCFQFQDRASVQKKNSK